MWRKPNAPRRARHHPPPDCGREFRPLCPRLPAGFLTSPSGLGWLIPLQAKNKYKIEIKRFKDTLVLWFLYPRPSARSRLRRRREAARWGEFTPQSQLPSAEPRSGRNLRSAPIPIPPPSHPQWRRAGSGRPAQLQGGDWPRQRPARLLFTSRRRRPGWLGCLASPRGARHRGADFKHPKGARRERWGGALREAEERGFEVSPDTKSVSSHSAPPGSPPHTRLGLRTRRGP